MLNMGKATALPPLCASSDMLRGDLYLHTHSLISKGGQNTKIRLLQEDKKESHGNEMADDLCEGVTNSRLTA